MIDVEIMSDPAGTAYPDQDQTDLSVDPGPGRSLMSREQAVAEMTADRERQARLRNMRRR